MKVIKRPHNALLYYGVLTFLYLALTLILPANRAATTAYHLSSVQYHVLIFLIILPVTVIWFVAFYGYWKIKEYAALIKEEEEGQAFTYMADGLMWLAWGLPIPALIGTVVNAIANTHPDFYHASVIINNYVTLIPPLVAFHILSSGSRTLLEHAGLRISIISTKVLIFSFVTLGALYCYFIFHGLNQAGAGSTNNQFFLPAWLLVFTIVIPYLYAWFSGLLAAYETSLVSKHAAGLLYKQALRHLSRGMTVIVASSIALQYLRSVLPRNGVSLGYLLLLIYAILLVIALGYALLAYGSKKLKKIEEV